VTIGPRTSAAARELGFNVAAEADATDATSLAAAVERVARAQAGRHA
jgi:uroporphyrinogen-III synthase